MATKGKVATACDASTEPGKPLSIREMRDNVRLSKQHSDRLRVELERAKSESERSDILVKRISGALNELTLQYEVKRMGLNTVAS